MGDLINPSDAKNISNGINPLVKIRYANLSGRSKRRLERANTIHLSGFCPNCGGRAKYRKTIPTGRYDAKGNMVYDRNKWVCKSCGSKYARKELEYTKYD